MKLLLALIISTLSIHTASAADFFIDKISDIHLIPTPHGGLSMQVIGRGTFVTAGLTSAYMSIDLTLDNAGTTQSQIEQHCWDLVKEAQSLQRTIKRINAADQNPPILVLKMNKNPQVYNNGSGVGLAVMNDVLQSTSKQVCSLVMKPY